MEYGNVLAEFSLGHRYKLGGQLTIGREKFIHGWGNWRSQHIDFGWLDILHLGHFDLHGHLVRVGYFFGG